MNKIIFDENKILRRYSGGVESDIYYYKVNNKVVFLKLFKKEIHFHKDIKVMDKEILENKRKKLEIISESPLFSNEVTIYDLAYDEYDNFIGYTMKIDSLKTAYDVDKTKKKIEILKLVRDKLEIFNKNGIYIGDFNPRNIIISDNIKLCDLDNFKINDLDFDILNSFQLVHSKENLDKNSIDNFSFNMQTVSYIGNIYIPYTIHYIEDKGLPRKLNTKKNKDLSYKLLNGNNCNSEYFIDNLRKFI